LVGDRDYWIGELFSSGYSPLFTGYGEVSQVC